MNILGLRDDGRDLLMAAALSPATTATSAWLSWSARDRGDRLDAVAERWLPIIAANLRHVNLAVASRQRLDDARRRTWLANVQLRAEADRVMETLAASGIDVMVIKGAALDEAVYPLPGTRLLGDVDLLVPHASALHARRVVSALGWIAARHLDDADVIGVHAMNYSRPPQGHVDIHWNFLRECCWPEADLGVWNRAQTSLAGGQRVLVPSYADLLMHSCVHGLRWSPVHSAHWVSDAYYILRKARGDLDWSVLIAEARARRLVCQVSESLALVERLTDAVIPSEVFRALSTSLWAVSERLECGVKGLPPSTLGGAYTLWRDWRRVRGRARAGGPSLFRYVEITLGDSGRRRLIPRAIRWFIRAMWIRRPRLSGRASHREMGRQVRP